MKKKTKKSRCGRKAIKGLKRKKIFFRPVDLERLYHLAKKLKLTPTAVVRAALEEMTRALFPKWKPTSSEQTDAPGQRLLFKEK